MSCGVGAPPAAVQAREAETEREPWAERPGLRERKRGGDGEGTVGGAARPR